MAKGSGALKQKEECSFCQGTGWIPDDQEGLRQVRRCSCFTDLVKKRINERCNIPSRYIDCSFENYEMHDPSHNKAKKIAEKFVATYPGIDTGLFFIGSCGVGKTHLAVAILKSLIDRKMVDGIFYDSWELLKAIQNTFSSDSALSESQVLSPVIEKELVVLDDLGAQKVTDWRRDILMYILNKRYNDKKPTIITSNWKLAHGDVEGEESLEERVGARLLSRLYEMCVIVEIKGKDYRKSFKQDGYRQNLR